MRLRVALILAKDRGRGCSTWNIPPVRPPQSILPNRSLRWRTRSRTVSCAASHASTRTRARKSLQLRHDFSRPLPTYIHARTPAQELPRLDILSHLRAKASHLVQRIKVPRISPQNSPELPQRLPVPPAHQKNPCPGVIVRGQTLLSHTERRAPTPNTVTRPPLRGSHTGLPPAPRP